MAQQRMEPGRKKAPAVVNASKSASKRGFYLVIAGAAVVGIVALSYLSGQKTKSPPIVLDPNLPPVTSQGYLMGSSTAPIEVVEFGDFECPACNRFTEVTEPDVRTQFINSGKIRFRFIDFPLLNVHRNTLNASVAAACADQQGQFWPMHDALYAKQDQWNGEATSSPDKILKDIAHALPGIDAAKFDQCLDTRQTLGKVQSHLKIATDAKVQGTPTFIIGGKMYDQLSGFDEFKQAVDQAIAAAESAKGGSLKTAGKTNKP
jgi:protein-disulfide isomerase